MQFVQVNGFGRFVKLPTPVTSTDPANPLIENGRIKIGMFVTGEAVIEAHCCPLSGSLD